VTGDGEMAGVAVIALDFGKLVVLETLSMLVTLVRILAGVVAIGTLPTFIAGAVVHLVYLALVLSGTESLPALDVVATTSGVWLLFGLAAGAGLWIIGRGRRLEEHMRAKIERFHRWDGVVHCSVIEGPIEKAGFPARVFERFDGWLDARIYPPLTLVKPEYVTILPGEGSSESDGRSSNCGVCGEAVTANLVRCRRCEAPHHRDCWDFVGGCSIYGCGCKSVLGGEQILQHQSQSDQRQDDEGR
jgi:hypothetical protein